ncbi:MAG: hypothetical protein Q9182_005964 [Xanthomendoza sp. 2 TL-2023]
MPHARCLRLLLYLVVSLLFLVDPTVQVTITLSSVAFRTHNGPGPCTITTTCTDILPGVCCMHPDLQGAETVTFTRLTMSDIAAVWRVPLDNVTSTAYCGGPVLDSSPGPGTWIWRTPTGADAAEMGLVGSRARGASYISVPRALPPDDKTSKWAMGEGILAMAWGGGSWFGDAKAQSLLGFAGSSGVGPRDVLPRDVRSRKKGKLWARPPLREVFPDLVEINGTRYARDGTSDIMYAATNSGAAPLNLTDLFFG